MGKLAYIHHDAEIDIPRPLCARPGEVYEAFRFDADLPEHMEPGAIFVVLLGVERHGWLHAVQFVNTIQLARLSFYPDGIKVGVKWLHRARSGDYPYKSLNVLGCVTEIYPTGDLSIRVVYHMDGLRYAPSVYERPFLTVKGPRNCL